MASPILNIGGRMRMKHRMDPKEYWMNEAKEKGLTDIRLMLNRILVVLYIRRMTATATVGNIELPDSVLQEDAWQGKVGLVVGMGPLAYKDDETTKFHGERVNVGDWVWFRPANGIEQQINGLSCRLFTELDIYGVIDHPDDVY